MNQLNNTTTLNRPKLTERIIQFGGGNFLRAFADWMIDIMNEKVNYDSSVIVVKPTPRGEYSALNNQDGLFHVLIRGIENGGLVQYSRLVKCISRTIQPYQDFQSYLRLAEQASMRFVLSNTTEAGIAFEGETLTPHEVVLSFPGKLTQWLYHRFQFFEGAPDKGLIILPCELIENNGQKLKECVLKYAESWAYEDSFKEWIEEHNTFCNTLVDRIVTGFPKQDAEEIQQQLGCQDQLIVAAEPYYVWVIEDPNRKVAKEFPTLQARLNVQFVDDLTKHRTLKVRILNGAHTAMVPVGYLNGLRTVRESIEHEGVGTYIHELIHNDILPTLEYSEAEKVSYAQAVMDRFKNPFIEHYLADIALNSIAKFKTRLLPSLSWYTEQEEVNHSPDHILTALAALITFYKGEWGGEKVPLRDRPESLQFFQTVWQEAPNTKDLVNTIMKEQINGKVNMDESLLNKLIHLLESKHFLLK